MDNKYKKSYGDYRRSIYASINATKGNLIRLRKSKLLKSNELEALNKIISSIEEFRLIYDKNQKESYNKYINNKDKEI
jgi:hypothetical protein